MSWSCLHSVNSQRIMYTAKVMAQARRVPWGMATLGFLRSPDMLAPAVHVYICGEGMEGEGEGDEGGKEGGK